VGRSELRVVLDSDVIYGINSTDLLLTLAQNGLFQAHWTERIIEDAMRNLLANRSDLARTDIARRFELMNLALPDALIEVSDALVLSMPINEDDRHVMAAATSSDASIIVTNNLRHFPEHELTPYGLQALSVDQFVAKLAQEHIEGVGDAIEMMAQRRLNPEKTTLELLDDLEVVIPSSIPQIRTLLKQRSATPLA